MLLKSNKIALNYQLLISNLDDIEDHIGTINAFLTVIDN